MIETSRTQQSTRAEGCENNHETPGNAKGCGEGFHRSGGISDILQPIPIEEASECIDEEKRKRHSPPARPSNGVQFAGMAINQLKKIDPRDTQRTEAFEWVIAWIADIHPGKTLRDALARPKEGSP